MGHRRRCIGHYSAVVGRQIRKAWTADQWKTTHLVPDLALTRQHGQLYMPVIFPGFSWTGLGLWITKDLLEKRGGRLRFRSTDSDRSGTVMTIYLPSL
jgi:hypothetical protein